MSRPEIRLREKRRETKCITFANNPEEGGWRLGHYDWCASQYYPADPNDFSTWDLTDEWYDANLGSAVPTAHFVIDTSRNGQGAWTQPADHPAGDPQDWCNPPDRGLGYRPTANTGQPLVDAYPWVKIPGESDASVIVGRADRLIQFAVTRTRPPGSGSPTWRSNWYRTLTHHIILLSCGL